MTQRIGRKFISGSPKCAPSMRLEDIREDMPEFRAMILKGKKHLDFIVEAYAWQVFEGRLVLHGHPWTSTSWKWPTVKKVVGIEGEEVRRGDRCCSRPRLQDQSGDRLAVWPTGWMRERPKVIDRAALACTNDCIGGGMSEQLA